MKINGWMDVIDTAAIDSTLHKNVPEVIVALYVLVNTSYENTHTSQSESEEPSESSLRFAQFFSKINRIS